MITKITNGKLVTDTIALGKNLYLKDDKIFDITAKDLPSDITIDAQGHYVSPGFIDIHTHGGGGYDFMDGTQSVIEAAKLHFQHGTTTIFPTTASSSVKVLKKALDGIKTAMELESDDMPHICGAHLEGPYFAQSQAGAQNPLYITPPIKEDYEEILETYDGIVKRWSFAPELAGGIEFCNTLVSKDIVPSIAHSDAIYEDVLQIYEAGCQLVTHLYSGMSTITRKDGYRRLGVVETSYLLDDMTVEVIADGCHLPPELLKLIFKLKGAEHICLVTDSMRGAGMPDGPSVVGSLEDGLPCIIEDGVAKLPDRSAFAGSVATADRLIRTFVKDVGVSIPDAVKMMTKNPAKAMNLKNKGQLKKGYDADIIFFDENINISRLIKTKMKYQEEN